MYIVSVLFSVVAALMMIVTGLNFIMTCTHLMDEHGIWWSIAKITSCVLGICLLGMGVFILTLIAIG